MKVIFLDIDGVLVTTRILSKVNDISDMSLTKRASRILMP